LSLAYTSHCTLAACTSFQKVLVSSNRRPLILAQVKPLPVQVPEPAVLEVLGPVDDQQAVEGAL